jgi:hypothetical protein
VEAEADEEHRPQNAGDVDHDGEQARGGLRQEQTQAEAAASRTTGTAMMSRNCGVGTSISASRKKRRPLGRHSALEVERHSD